MNKLKDTFLGLVFIGFSLSSFANNLQLRDSKFPENIQSAASPYIKGQELIEFKTDYEPPWGFLYEIVTLNKGVLTEYNFLGNGKLIKLETKISSEIPKVVLDEYNRFVPDGIKATKEERTLLSVVGKDGKEKQTVWYEFDGVKLADGSVIEVMISENGTEAYIRKMKPAR